ncbi:DUF948 domain-containing protein [Sporosarcina oncorhynchi]|uniref:DUF948 domain-containing protein n=1 Tax=Sporosarcina oncorhynchi TaxID=3056444 RepID=A0ABZ0LBD4_9BACL|nr:DUF948 domain-containing protein [Sporosarcina sp. T2O-4]WOV88939.1 DUF948 domain-containing protein [Sporosarcina sp. T2O-4]
MDLTGIGVLLIGVAFLVLAVFLARVLNQTAKVVDGVGKTIERLPDQLDGVIKESEQLIQNSNNTLADVNVKLGTLTPVFNIVGDVGEVTGKLTSSVHDFTLTAKKKIDTTDEDTRNKRLGGLYGASALAYYTIRSGKERKKVKSTSTSNLYMSGEQRMFDVNRMKEEAKEAARIHKHVSDDL